MERASHFPWVITLRRTDASALGTLRLGAGVEIGEEAVLLWVRGPASAAVTVAQLASLPCVAMFEWIAPETLRPLGSRLASGTLPALRWVALAEWCSVALPRSRFAAPRATAALELVHSGAEEPANALLADLEAFAQWADAAPRVRLKRLRFAVSPEGTVLVVGFPLPAFASRPLVEKDGVLVPAGRTWSPGVSTKTLRTALGAGASEKVLWTEAGVQAISEEMLVPATRAAIRAACSRKREGSLRE